MYIIPVMGKPHWQTFLIINVENSFAAYCYFCWNHRDTFFNSL